jgi:hypothetical protein
MRRGSVSFATDNLPSTVLAMSNSYEDEYRQELRKEMAAIRAVGKGSRGGPGAAKRRKKTQHAHPRRQSMAQYQRETDAKNFIVADISTYLSENDRKRTLEFLRKNHKIDVDKLRSPAAFWKHLVERDSRFSVAKADAKYVRAISYVYAVHEIVTSSGLFTEQHISMICEKAGVSPKRNIDLLRVIARLLIDYDDGTAKKPAETRRAVSRDAKAIRWLMGEGVRPHEV